MSSFAQVQLQSLLRTPRRFLGSSFLYRDNSLSTKTLKNRGEISLISNTRFKFKYLVETENGGKMICRMRKSVLCNGFLLPVDPWAPNIDSQSIASQLFAFSLFPYLGFLYFITKSRTAPKLTLFGFYFLLAFVGATIPAGIYAKVHYGTSLSNVDWLHGGAESLLTLTNLFIVLGLREAIRKATDENEKPSDLAPEVEDNEKSSV